MRNYKIVSVALASALLLLGLYGCEGSTSGLSAEPNPDLDAVQGPLNYETIESRFKSSTAILNLHDAKTSVSPAGYIDFTAGILGSLIPESEAVFGPIEAIAGFFSEMEVAAEINELQSEISQLQNEINQLQDEFNAASVFYNNFVLQQQEQWAASALNFWQTALNTADANKTASSSYYGNMLNAIGTQSLSAAALNQNTMAQLNLLSTNSQLPYSVANLANGLSGSTLNSGVIPIYKGVQLDVNTTSGNPTTTCQAADTKQTLDLLACQLNYLLTQLPTPGSQGQNVIPTLNAYNDQVMMIWQNSLMALQYLYTVEATSSYLNYLNYKAYMNSQVTKVTNLNMQIVPFEQIGGMLFSVGTDLDQISPTSSSINAQNLDGTFNQYQTNLLLVYAARVNALYQVVMSYVVSDQPFEGQSYAAAPTATIGGQTIQLAPQASLYKTINAMGLTSSVQNKSIPPVTGGVFYQYSGINQLYTCTGPNVTKPTTTASGIATYEVNLSDCVSAFPDSNASTYDGVNISGFYRDGTSPNNETTPTTNTLNMSTYCATPANPAIWGEGGVMTCGNWGGSELANNNLEAGEWYIGLAPYINYGICGTDACIVQYPNDFGTDTTFGYNYYMQYHNHTGYMLYIPYAFQLIASSCGLDRWSWGGCDYGNYGNGIHDGEIAGDQVHYALLSIELPNGYNLPLYFLTYASGVNGHDYSMLVCPSTMGANNVPGINWCNQENTNIGGVLLQTADGHEWYIYIAQYQGQIYPNITAGSGNGTGYLVIDQWD